MVALTSRLRWPTKLSAAVSNLNVKPPRMTTLSNKMRVVTKESPGHFSGVGVYVDVGTKHETGADVGVCHFLDRMQSHIELEPQNGESPAVLEGLRDQIQSSSSREVMAYQSQHFPWATPSTMSLLSRRILAPITPQDLVAQKDAIAYEVREISQKPMLFLPEVLHGIAYKKQGLGHSLLCDPERIEGMDGRVIEGFRERWYRADRMVIAGMGVEHEELVNLADRFFSSFKPSEPSSLQDVSSRTDSALSTKSGYVGGHAFIPNDTEDDDHIFLAYEGAGINDDDIYTLAVMQVLLGGGGSFSAGGPGKGMYSRLYTHILNRYGDINHFECFHHVYADSSLFGIVGAFAPGSRRLSSSDVFTLMVHQLSLLAYSPINSIELSRAKKQLKSALMMSLESRGVEVEDMGRQILARGEYKPIEEVCEAIDNITIEDIPRVARKMFGQQGGPATVLCKAQKDIGNYQRLLRDYGLSA